MKATFSQVRHPSHPGRGCGSLTCHMTHFEQSDWLRSPNLTNIMIELSFNNKKTHCNVFVIVVEEHIYLPTTNWMDYPQETSGYTFYDDDIKWKHFPRYRPFVRGIHPVTGGFLSQRPVELNPDI